MFVETCSTQMGRSHWDRNKQRPEGGEQFGVGRWTCPVCACERKSRQLVHLRTHVRRKKRGKKKKSDFEPRTYDSSHLGHARNYVTFDVIRRILTDHFNYDMFCVMNITDVDDVKKKKNV
jgi:hypothetical protein